MKVKQNLFYMIIAVAIYALNKSMIIPNTSGTVGYFCRCYLNDLVCPLFFLSASKIILMWAGYEIHTYKVYVILCLVAGIIWECFIPLIKPGAVKDVWDLVCYFVGTTIYYFISKMDMKGTEDGKI